MTVLTINLLTAISLTGMIGADYFDRKSTDCYLMSVSFRIAGDDNKSKEYAELDKEYKHLSGKWWENALFYVYDFKK